MKEVCASTAVRAVLDPPQVVACGECSSPMPASRRRCAECGFSPDELRRWRARNLDAWRACQARLKQRTWQVAAYVALRPVPYVIIYSVVTRVGRDPTDPRLPASVEPVMPAVRAMIRFAEPTITILGVIVAVLIDLALRELPPWMDGTRRPGAGARSWFDRWWPGASLLVVAARVVRYQVPPFGFDAWSIVYWATELLLSLAAVGAAASLAMAAARMDRWSALIVPAADAGRHPPQVGPRIVRRVFVSWCVLAAVLMAYPLSRIGSLAFSTPRDVGQWLIVAICWATEIVWLWNLLAVQRSLRRWVND